MLIQNEILYDVSQWLVAGALLALLLAVEELGFRLGRRRRADYDDDARSNYGNLQGGLFGLMALLLAFTFAMAQARYDLRNDLVVVEANAIGTAWLRTEFLPEPARGEVRAALRRYTGLRTPRYDEDNDARSALYAEWDRLHAEIWSRVAAASAADPHSLPLSLLVAATNDVIDVHGKRIAVGRNHVPEPVILLVFVFGIAAAGLTGYRCGVGLRRYRLPSTAFLVLVTLVITVIIDLDRPRRGIVNIDQRPLYDLQRSLTGS